MEQQDKLFQDLMRSYRTEKVSENFSDEVMGKIYMTPKQDYKPVFGTWLPRILTVLFGVFLICSFFSPASSGTSASLAQQIFEARVESVAEGINAILGKVPREFIFVAFASLMLLLVDRFLLYRHEARKNKSSMI